MAVTEVFDSIAQNFISNPNESFMYFSLPELLMHEVENLLRTNYTVIDLLSDFEPVKPFFSILKNLDIDSDTIENYAYSLHKPFLNDYFHQGLCSDRLDVVHISEIHFEVYKIREFINKVFNEKFTGNYLILNSQKLPKESIETIRSIYDKNFGGKIIFCFNCDEIENSSPEVIRFYQSIENHKNFYNLNDFDEVFSNQKDIHLPKLDFDTIYNSLKNCRILLSLGQGFALCSWLEDALPYIDFNKYELRKLYFEIALMFFYNKSFNEAQYYLMQIIDFQIEDETMIASYMVLCRVLHEKNADNFALKYALLIKQRLNNNSSSPYYALANMMEYTITQKSDFNTAIDKFYNVLELLNFNSLMNNYVHTCFDVPWAIMNNNSMRQELLPFIENAIEISEQIGNEAALSTGYNWKGIILLHEGRTEEAHYWYERCNELRTKINDIPGMIKIRNGLSYEYLTRTQYKKSYNLLNEMSDKLLEIKDHAEAVITLNNIANTLFFSRHFLEAYTFYQKILRLLVLLQFDKKSGTSFLPEYNDILIHKTYIDLFDGNINRAKINFHNILHNKRTITKINEPLKLLFQSVFVLFDDELEESKALIEEAESKFESCSVAQTFQHVFILYEYATFLRECGYENEVEYYIQKAFNIAKENKLEYYIKGENEPLSLDEYMDHAEFYVMPKIDLEQLEETIKKEKLVGQMHKRLRDSQFLNKIMSISTNFDCDDAIFSENVIHAISDYTIAEAIYIAIKPDDKWEILAKFSKKDDLDITQKTWNDFSEKYSDAKYQGKIFYDSASGWYFGNNRKYRYAGAIIIVPDKSAIFSSEDLNVLNIAISNVHSQYVIRKQRDRLQFISATDQLSMLNNRRSLMEKMEIESEMIQRYAKNKPKHFQTTISFIDLDNFKYINDTFGHNAGDLIIKCFAQSLKKIYRKVDFVSRFGGDEFVILMPSTNCLEAKRAAERLYKELNAQNHYISQLSDLLKTEIDIPENKRLRFSMGICSNYDIEDPTDLELTMKNADHALYYSKKHGKNQIVIWSDIKDEYNGDE